MVKVIAFFDIYGKDFYICNLEKYENTFIVISRKTEIEKKGRNKGKPRGYNSIYIETPTNITDFSERIHWVLDKYDLIRNEIEQQKETQKEKLNIIFKIIIYWNAQCNFGFEPDLIKRFYLLNENINITCCELNDDEFSKIEEGKNFTRRGEKLHPTTFNI